MRSNMMVAAGALVLGGIELVVAQTPLINKRYPYAGVPYQVDTVNGDRGRQTGYNICNSTTEGPNSLCQTLIFNDVSDFCLWGAISPNSVVGNIEGEMVSYCTKSGHGSRLIPPGAITGVQAITTPGYFQIAGYFDQTQLNIRRGDSGGELDPHGADLRGNPLGSLVYGTGIARQNAANNTSPLGQYVSWNSFVGSGVFCFKACFNSNDFGSTNLCQNVYDTVGCEVNMPLSYAAINGSFTDCKGDNQLPVGQYYQNGQLRTWPSPGENGNPNPPYKPVVPATSQCTTYSSAQLYGNNNAASISTAPGSVSLATTTSRSSPTTMPIVQISSTSTSTVIVTATPQSASMVSTTQPPRSVTTGGAGRSAGSSIAALLSLLAFVAHAL